MFYWPEKNFGDLLTPDLLYWRYGISVPWTTSKDAQLQVIGSIIQATPLNWGGIVCGTGLIEDRQYHLPNADIRVLRGKKTAANLGATAPLYGDPGLLATDLITLPSGGPRWDVGLIPHYVDKGIIDTVHQHHPELDSESKVVLHVASDSIPNIIHNASLCKVIHTSSLHGLVLADALGIPRVYYPHKDVIGAGFKFQDYASAFGETIEPYVVHSPPRDTIRNLQDSLRACLDEVIIKELKWADKLR